MTQRMAAPILGNGLLLAEGAAWRRQRRMLQPAFARKQLAGYVDDIAHCSGALAESWADGAARDVYVDALACSIQIAARTLFGASLGSEAERAHAALEGAMAAFDRFKHSRLPLPLSIPTPNGLRLRRAARNLERVVYALIAQRRSSQLLRDDLLRDPAASPRRRRPATQRSADSRRGDHCVRGRHRDDRDRAGLVVLLAGASNSRSRTARSRRSPRGRGRGAAGCAALAALELHRSRRAREPTHVPTGLAHVARGRARLHSGRLPDQRGYASRRESVSQPTRSGSLRRARTLRAGALV